MTVTPIRQHPIVRYDSLFSEMLRLKRAGGLPRGQSTGWRCLDELYTVLPGQFTVISGFPGSGKSEWLDSLLVNLAETDEWAFAIYSPENWPPITHVVKLLEKRVRKPFAPGPTEPMTEAEAKEGFFWVGSRFMWMDPDLKTPDELVKIALDYQRAGKFGIVLDPWNTLDHQRGTMSETDYVAFILTEVIKLCRAANAHIWLVVHPQKIVRNKDGTRPVPTPYDLSGSAHWYNKADNIITVHRDQTDPRSQDVDIHVQKVRFKHVGRAGLASLKYDKVIGTYFEFPGAIPGELYADPERGQVPSDAA